MQKRKWPLNYSGPRVVRVSQARVLGGDEYGTWLYCPAGQEHRRTDSSAMVAGSAGVQLLTDHGW